MNISNSHFWRTVFVFSIVLFSYTVSANSISIIEYGIYGDLSRVGKQEAPETETGEVNIINAYSDPMLLEQTDKIIATIGTAFGIKVAAGVDKENDNTGDLVSIEIHVLYPATQNKPAGVEKWNMYTQVGFPRYTGWLFEKETELIAGTWNIQVHQNNELIAEQIFEIILQ